MNKILIILSLVLIASCGPSQKDKNIAAVTCSIMSETRYVDAAIRVEKMNDAREKIGGEPFLGGDDAIQEAFEYGLCQELVLNESYDEILEPLKDAKRERERIAREKQAEENRIAAEKRAEEQRIAAEKQRIADSKPTVKEEFYSSGKLKNRTTYQSKINGAEQYFLETYNENGQLQERTNYKNGNPDDLQELFYENGQLKTKRTFKLISGRVKVHGLYEEYHENGQLQERGNYKDGELDGLWEKYHENGELESKNCSRSSQPTDMSYCEK